MKILSTPAVVLWLLFGQVSEPSKSRPQALDAGQPQLSEEDLEVLMNLDLLEHLGESDDLELLLALSGSG